jgi:hypothetical protein
MGARPEARFAPRTVSGFLWRVLVPSWRFFEAEDARFLLEARFLRHGEAPSPFMRAVPARARTPLSWLFAPEHNFALFCHDLIERFVSELAERPLSASEVEALPSYGRVRDLSRHFLREAHASTPELRFQLRLLALNDDDDDAREELFLSPAYALEG